MEKVEVHIYEDIQEESKPCKYHTCEIASVEADNEEVLIIVENERILDGESPEYEDCKYNKFYAILFEGNTYDLYHSDDIKDGKGVLELIEKLKTDFKGTVQLISSWDKR